MITIPKLIKKSTLFIYKKMQIMETKTKIGTKYEYSIMPRNFGLNL